MTSRDRLTLLLTAALALLLLLACAGWIWMDVDQPRLVNPVDYRIPSALSGDRSAPADVDALLERPVFWAGRRPVQQQAEPDAVVASADGLRVVGIFVKDGAPVALIHTGQNIARARQGDDVAGWKVDTIEEQAVELSSSGRTARLQVVSPRNSSIRLQPVEES